MKYKFLQYAGIITTGLFFISFIVSTIRWIVVPDDTGAAFSAMCFLAATFFRIPSAIDDIEEIQRSRWEDN